MGWVLIVVFTSEFAYYLIKNIIIIKLCLLY